MNNNATKRYCFPSYVLEMISNIIGDTNEGLTGTEIGHFLAEAKIEETEKDKTLTKRIRLFNALAQNQNKNKCSNQILIFIQKALAPARYVSDRDKFERYLTKINQQLAFVGYKLQENVKYIEVKKANTISDVEIKVENLKQELQKRKIHQEIFKYCKAELLHNNYFHSVLEAEKGLFERIRELSGISEDGNKLIEQVFSSTPFLIINNYQTSSEKNEHIGFCNLLKGLCSMFRNPVAHEPKIVWEIGEQDALEILGIISYCHRRLDKAQKIR